MAAPQGLANRGCPRKAGANRAGRRMAGMRRCANSGNSIAA